MKFVKFVLLITSIVTFSLGCSDSDNDTETKAPVGYGDFNNALLEEMRDSDSPDAIYVINLLKFKSQAAYADGRTTGLTGEEAYELYSSAGHPQRFGGDLFHSTQISTTMTGSEVSGDSSTWDREEISLIIDVGTNAVDDPTRERGYRLVGDVAFAEVKEVATAITPSPGGVGPMTIAMLLRNTTDSAKRTVGME